MDEDNSKKKNAGDSNECVSVVVRCRPLNSNEKSESRASIIEIDVAARQVVIRNPADQEKKSFTYDGAYDEGTQQRIFYEESCFGIIEGVLEGFNGTIFAYGQTGTSSKRSPFHKYLEVNTIFELVLEHYLYLQTFFLPQ